MIYCLLGSSLYTLQLCLLNRWWKQRPSGAVLLILGSTFRRLWNWSGAHMNVQAGFAWCHFFISYWNRETELALKLYSLKQNNTTINLILSNSESWSLVLASGKRLNIFLYKTGSAEAVPDHLPCGRIKKGSLEGHNEEEFQCSYGLLTYEETWKNCDIL